MEEEFFYTPMQRHQAWNAETPEQEIFLTPAYRHGPPDFAEVSFSTPVANGDGNDENDVTKEIEEPIDAPVVEKRESLDGEDGKKVWVESNDAEVDSLLTDKGEVGFVTGEHHQVLVARKIGNGEIVEDPENGEYYGAVSGGQIVAAIGGVTESEEVCESGEYRGMASSGQSGMGEPVEAANDVAEFKEVSENGNCFVMVSDGQNGIGEIVEVTDDVAESEEESEIGECPGMDSNVQSGIGEILKAASDGVERKEESENEEYHGLVSDWQVGIGETLEVTNDAAELKEVSENEDYGGMVSDGQTGIQEAVEAATGGIEPKEEFENGEFHELVSDEQIGNNGEFVKTANDVTEKEVFENGKYRAMVSDGQNGNGETVEAVSDSVEPKEKPENGEYYGFALDTQIDNGEIVEAANDVAKSKEEISSEQEVREVLDCSVSSVQIRNMPSEAVGTVNAYASVVNQAEGDQPSFRSRPQFRKEREEEEDGNESSSQSAETTTSRIQTSGMRSLPARPAGLGSSAPLLEPAPCPVQHPKVNGAVPQRVSQLPEDPPSDGDPEENEETRKKLQDIRVKFLRLARRLGQTPHNVVVAQVLYRLGLAEQLSRNTNRTGVFSFDRASVMAEQLEAAGEDLNDFTCTIMVIGKSGVGKSATINSILDEDTKKVRTDAFQSGTKKVQVINGKVQGVDVRVIDTPGLFTCSSDQHRNGKNLNFLKQLISKNAPDIVLYFDRLDMHSRDNGDLLLLRTITDVFGPSIWFNAIVVLTHAASPPPDDPNGIPLSYDTFVNQRTHVVQQAIRAAAGDVRLMNPVSLVENHSACRTNGNGQRVLPNEQVWKPQLLLLSFASKILAEANMLLKLQDSPTGRPFGTIKRIPPLLFFLSPLLQSRPQLKLPDDQSTDDDAGLEDSEGTSDADDGSDYDDLPPFKNLTKSQLAKLTKAQKKAYFEELEYREKLFWKKQLKEERKHRKLRKNIVEAAKDLTNDSNGGSVEDESSSPASVPVAMPDLVLPTSFDSDNPAHRYRFLDTSNQWIVRPVLETQGWDHDIGYEGLNLERLFVVKDTVPVSISGQLTKDKKESTLQMEVASSIKHGEAGATSLSLDVQTLGKEMAYTFRGETRVKNFRRNSTTAGVSVSLLGDAVLTGAKIEDKLVVNKRFRFLVSGGAMTGRGDVAYGGRLEATLRDKDYPIGRMLSTLALSVLDWRGDLAIGCNVQSQLPLGRGTNVVGHANLSNRGTGQVGIRLNSSEQLQIALIALLPVFRSLKRILFDSHDCT